MCSSCLEQWEKENTEKKNPFTCPQCCTAIVKEKTVPNGIINRLITTSINVKCDNSEKGCEWIGVISDIMIHMKDKCDFTVIKCLNERCTEKVQRKMMDVHIEECLYRIISCCHCGSKLAFIDQENHFEGCEHIRIKCSNVGCLSEFPRKEIENHLQNDCEMKMVSCKYSSMGCDFKSYRKDLINHYEASTTQHIDIIFNELVETKKQLAGISASNQVSKILLIDLDEIEKKSHFFKDLNQAVFKVQKMNEELRLKIDLEKDNFDQWSILDGNLDDLNRYMRSLVDTHKEQLNSLKTPFITFDANRVKNEFLGDSTLLLEDDNEELLQKIQKLYDKKMKEMNHIDYEEEAYKERFEILLESMDEDRGYHYGDHLFMKIDITYILLSGSGDIYENNIWTLEITKDEYEFDCSVDSEQEIIEVTLDKLYYSAGIVSPYWCDVKGLTFDKCGRGCKRFDIDVKELMDYNVDIYVLFRFTNNRF